jgi:hypothetical protein
MIRSGTTNPYTAENLARIVMMSLSKMDHFRKRAFARGGSIFNCSIALASGWLILNGMILTIG